MTRAERQSERVRIKAARKAARDAQVASMSEREKTAWSIGGLVVLALAFLGLVTVLSGPKSGTSGSTSVKMASALPHECPVSSVSRDVIVKGEAKVLTAPRDGAPPLSRTVGSDTLAATIDTSVAVRELCQAGGWSLIRVLGPQELRKWQGWVPSPSLGAVPVTGSGRRVYRPADFNWPNVSKPEQARLVKVINRIVEDRPDCEVIDTASLVATSSGATRRYSVGCFGPEAEGSFTFTAADASNGRSFVPVEPISKVDAIWACKNAIRKRASHPSTVEFPSFDYDQRDGGDGTTQLLMSFSAKNAFNLELRYDAQCDFRGTDLFDVILSEARD